MVNDHLTMMGISKGNQIDPRFWAGRRVFLTGHTGFKGAWLAFWLAEMGAQVTGYALAPSTEPNLFDLLGLQGRLDHHEADVRDAPTLQAVMKRAQPEIVFHLAAQPLVQLAHDDPADTFASNVMGTVNVLDGVRMCPSVRAAVMVTSDKVYQNCEWSWRYREDDRLGGDDPYSASKAAAEASIHAYRATYFQGADQPTVVAVRSGNVIGGGDFSEYRIVPDIVRAITAADRTVQLRNPQATRPWMHVLDSLAGYLQAAEVAARGDLTTTEALNFGPIDPTPLPVLHLTQHLAQALGGAKIETPDKVPGVPENLRLAIDPTRAVVTLGWKPQLSMTDNLNLTATWYRAWHEGEDMVAISRRHLESWMSPQTVPEAVSA